VTGADEPLLDRAGLVLADLFEQAGDQ